MDFWDVFEIGEIEDYYEKQEKSYLNHPSNQLENYSFGYCNIAVALSPHLSEDQISEEIPETKSYNNKASISNKVEKNSNSPIIIGTLTFEERQIKLKRYREKKKNRIWKKKINYNCRKKVAENRLRIKGRFVTKEQALVLQKLNESYESVV